MKSYSNSDTDEKNNDKGVSQIVGNKHPKDDSQIIEELKVLSGQLRNSVQTLLIQLDERNKEIEKLKATIKQLEGEKVKGIEFHIIYKKLKLLKHVIGSCFYFFYNHDSSITLFSLLCMRAQFVRLVVLNCEKPSE